jgi:hypothetical protein
MATLTPNQCAHALNLLGRAVAAQMIIEGNKGLAIALRYAVTKYMEGGASGAGASGPSIMSGMAAKRFPPNPPPGPLKKRSGDLARDVRIKRFVAEGDNFWVGGLQAGFAVRYAKIQELGGHTSPHDIVPRNARVLAWPIATRVVVGSLGVLAPKNAGRASAQIYAYAMRVHHPGSNIPARPYMTPALQDARPEIIALIDNAATVARQKLGL